MAENHFDRRRSIHQDAFGHYLRTGQRFTNREWLSRTERKFNPYHDELGRFTSPPGVTVSWGNRQPGQTDQTASGGVERSDDRPLPAPPDKSSNAKEPAFEPAGETIGFRSKLVRESTQEAGRAETYFELNKRQAGLNRLREQAGPNPDQATKADLDEFQRRLDADRARLEEITRKVIDPATIDILREGLPPADMVAGAINVARGDGEFSDYVAVASVVPLSRAAKIAGKIVGATGTAAEAVAPELVKIIQKGGSYYKVKGLKGYHAHHIPANKASPISKGRGPAIAMTAKDHRLTASYGPGGKKFRKRQKELIDQGDFRGAQQMDIDDIRAKFGDKYDDAIEQMLQYTRQQGF